MHGRQNFKTSVEKKAKLSLNTFSFPEGWVFPEYKGNTFFLNHLQVAACFLN